LVALIKYHHNICFGSSAIEGVAIDKTTIAEVATRHFKSGLKPPSFFMKTPSRTNDGINVAMFGGKA
jgi:hypothetical protein